jgi:hypothetical protein
MNDIDEDSLEGILLHITYTAFISQSWADHPTAIRAAWLVREVVKYTSPRRARYDVGRVPMATEPCPS